MILRRQKINTYFNFGTVQMVVDSAIQHFSDDSISWKIEWRKANIT